MVRPALIALVLVAALGCSVAREVPEQHRGPRPPVWPDSYMVAYTITLPYTASVQPEPVSIPTQIFYDKPNKRMRTSFFHGLDDTYVTPGTTFLVYPRITTRSCLAVGNSGGGPTVSEPLMAQEQRAEITLGDDDLVPPLPDLTGWEFAGTAHLAGKPPTYVWQLSQRHQERASTYTFHVAQADGRPVQLHMMGVNLFTGSHFDQYDVTFDQYLPYIPSGGIFVPPKDICSTKAAAKVVGPATEVTRRRMAVAQAHSLLPSALVPSAAALNTGAGGGGTGCAHATLAQRVAGVLARLLPLKDVSADVSTTTATSAPRGDDNEGVASRDLAAIQAWNSRVRSSNGPGLGPVAGADVFTMAPNQFLGLSHDQWAATRLGRTKGTKRSGGGFRSSAAHLGVYQRVLTNDQLPDSVDWRGTGADGPVKDQASCGSCWAFATTGAMTAAWWKATGQSLSFSEQQIVDCSWDYEVNGCWGGDVGPALTYIHAHGGASLEAEYPYKGVNGVCRENKTANAAAFKGFLSIPADEGALMEAVALHGPVAIAFDAAHITFKYYSEGVYHRDSCGTTVDDLDHAVVLVGYGTTPAGTDYWLLRNSWSQLWGEGGYFKITRKGNDCGITLDAAIAVVDPRAAEQARARSTAAHVAARADLSTA